MCIDAFRRLCMTLDVNFADSEMKEGGVRWSVASPVFRARSSERRIISRTVTMRDPKAMEPRLKDAARPKAERVGWFG